MKINRKLISVVCALTMIMSVFSAFVTVNATAEPTLKVVLTQEAKEKDETVKLDVMYDGFEGETNFKYTKFILDYDKTKFEYVGSTVSEASALTNPTPGRFIYSATTALGAIPADKPIASIELKLIDEKPAGSKFDFDLSFGDITNHVDGKDIAYKSKDGALSLVDTSYKVPDDEVTGPRLVAEVLENPASASETFKVAVSYAGFEGTPSFKYTKFILDYDKETLEYVGSTVSEAGALTNPTPGRFIYSATTALGAIPADEAIAIVEFKITDAATVAGTTFDFDLSFGDITNHVDGKDIAYKSKDGALGLVDTTATVGGGSIDPTPTPSTDPTPTPTPSTDPTPTPDMDTITGVKINPETTSVEAGGVVTFTATVEGTGTFDKTVKWSMTGASSDGTTLVDGTLTVAATETSEEIKVTATSVGDATKSATATVNVNSKTEFIITETTETVSGQIKYTAKIVKGELPTTVENIVILAQGYKKSASGKLDQPVAYTTIENVKASSVGEDGLEYSFTIFGAEKMNITVIDPATGNPLS